MLRPAAGQLLTPWGTPTLLCNRGVKQGGVESPILFSLAMSLIVSLARERLPSSFTSWLDIGFDDLNFMDDGICWAKSIKLLQVKMDSLVHEVSASHLRDCGGRSLRIGGTTLQALAPELPMTVMGLPVRPGINPLMLLPASWAKPDSSFGPTKQVSTPVLASSSESDCSTKLFGGQFLGPLAQLYRRGLPWKCSTPSCTPVYPP